MQLQKALQESTIGGHNRSEESEPKKKMSRTKNVKILTLLQLCTIIGVVLTAWFYVRPQHSASAAPCGLIDGILFSPDCPSVLIDGQVLREGDMIYGAKVFEIGRRIVTFEKNGKRWEQRVQQRPDPAWDDLALPSSDANAPPTPG
jgi:hypothetical protein